MSTPPATGDFLARGDSEAFRWLVDSVQDYAIFQLNPDGIITSWNLGAQRIKGYTAEEAIGRHFSMFYPEEARLSRWPEEELRWASVRGRFEDEGWRLRKDGERIWANVVITAIRDASGRLVGFSKVTRDLSERRRQEVLLREREENLRSLVEGVHDQAIYLVDPQGRIRTWNAGGERLLGHLAADVLGREVGAVVEPALAAIATMQPGGAAGPEARVVWEGWLRRVDGSTFWAQVATTAVKRPDGTVKGFVQVVQDISDRRRAASLETEGRRLTEFIAMLSHELRNPLAALTNVLSLLRAEALTERGLWSVGVASRQVSHVTRLIEDLLDVSRVSTGKIRLDLAPLDLAKVVHDAVEGVRAMVDSHAHDLILRLPAEGLATQGDATRLTQVVVNLVSNSAKYTPRGGRIEVALHAAHGLALLSVSDSGIGMAEDFIQVAFEPFVQGERQLDRSEGGLGIGLTLVKRIVELHGGTVAAISPGVGKGATVTVALPLATRAGAPPATAGADGAHAEMLRILVVDDNADAAESLVMILRIEGHDVKVAHGAAEALAIAAASRPQVVLLDLGLPGASGLEVARQLRAIPGLGQVRLIAVTGYGQPSDREATRQAGFDVHMVKPVDIDTLLRHLYAR
ncbi:hypothetical protein CDN99_21645 [Roseateles aquatilis]|uniref:histidine kinase n=1 Tax=Roseateles aquatilis TaxID=431061 RepID=A0A246IZE0_9BURK|nr:PAS domain S-box protein [Roseateles aquatilis]OWQ85685.1 hypothetical protein CDN99_21645 [Roseateles aquatilis]